VYEVTAPGVARFSAHVVGVSALFGLTLKAPELKPLIVFPVVSLMARNWRWHGSFQLLSTGRSW
jgi:hypothetical protein